MIKILKKEKGEVSAVQGILILVIVIAVFAFVGSMFKHFSAKEKSSMTNMEESVKNLDK